MNYFDCHHSVQILGLVNRGTSTARNYTNQFVGMRNWWILDLSISHGREEENIAVLEGWRTRIFKKKKKKWTSCLAVEQEE